LQQAIVEVPLPERCHEEVPHVVTIREGKRPLLRAVSHLHLEERRVLTDQDNHTIKAERFRTLVRPGGEKLRALLWRILVGTVWGDTRIRFDPQVLAKLLMNRGDLVLRRGNHLLTEKTRRILDASTRSLGYVDGDEHRSDGHEPSPESPRLMHLRLLSICCITTLLMVCIVHNGLVDAARQCVHMRSWFVSCCRVSSWLLHWKPGLYYALRQELCQRGRVRQHNRYPVQGME
jgi:hypothetical protein